MENTKLSICDNCWAEKAFLILHLELIKSKAITGNCLYTIS